MPNDWRAMKTAGMGGKWLVFCLHYLYFRPHAEPLLKFNSQSSLEHQWEKDHMSLEMQTRHALFALCGWRKEGEVEHASRCDTFAQLLAFRLGEKVVLRAPTATVGVSNTPLQWGKVTISCAPVVAGTRANRPETDFRALKRYFWNELHGVNCLHCAFLGVSWRVHGVITQLFLYNVVLWKLT